MTTPELVRNFAQAALSSDPGLAVAALMMARVEYPDLDPSRYLALLDFIGDEARRRLAVAAPAPDTPHDVDVDRYTKVIALNTYLFEELQFVGNEADYGDPRNSFLNEVLDRRTGIPITLSLVYMEVARRAGLPIEGINFPGHFLLRCRAGRGLTAAEDLIIDPFHRGALLSRELLARQSGGHQEPQDQDEEAARFQSRLLPPATKPQILSRMLTNLKRVYVKMHSFPQARDVADMLIAVDPSAISELRDRGLLAYHLKDFSGALRDLQAYLRLIPSGAQDDEERQDRERIWEHVKTLRKRVASLN
ncbi:MAG TPA: transglutaminase-like domain-containing protein [Vicinamibacterales bacterium]|nr:transglutaminase-like domain-containing protein [Vicinamibacterales bacterium]